jgi:acyl carrier protein
MDMTIMDMMQNTIQDYVEGFDIRKNLNYTLRQIGLDSLDQMEMAYTVEEKLDLKKKIPDNLTIGQMVSYLETVIGDNIVKDI